MKSVWGGGERRGISADPVATGTERRVEDGSRTCELLLKAKEVMGL